MLNIYVDTIGDLRDNGGDGTPNGDQNVTLTAPQAKVLALVGKYDYGFMAQGRQGRPLYKLIDAGLIRITGDGVAALTDAGRALLAQQPQTDGA